ncbi:MAG: hypothetical protein NZ700_02955 [Gemmataceae bacterium]|nr:hypothetical protein [Gemmataceae bacterium]MDW8266706.1 hypothetical protein [Gemmataceae bacterium]
MKNILASVFGLITGVVSAIVVLPFVPGLPMGYWAQLAGGVVIGGVLGGLVGSILGGEINLRESAAVRVGCGVVAGMIGGALGATRFQLLDQLLRLWR